MIGFFQWWYSEGFVQAWRIILYAAGQFGDFFTLPTLVRTWFAPWKNDQLAAHNVSLGDQVKIWELNVASRFIGFLVRSLVIFITILGLAVLLLLGAFSLVIWLLIPLSPLLLVIVALVLLA